MILRKKKYRLRFLSIITALSVIATLITPVYATDSVDSLEQSASDLEDELSGLNSELENLSSEISSITKKLTKMTARIEKVKEELAIAKGEEQAQYNAMKARIQYMYENGNSNLIEMLLSATSMADFLNRAEFFATISEYDRAELKKFEETKKTIAAQEAQLEQEQTDLIALQKELNAKEETLTSEISATSSELAACNAQLKKARDEANRTESTLNKEVEPVTPPSINIGSGTVTDTDFNYSATASDIELFAAIIECEAGSTNYEGMLAVASVIVNRMKHSRYPDTLRGVIYQSGQFPPAHNGKMDRILARGVKPSCVQVAKDALAGKNNVGNCLSFRAASSGHTGIIIGGNVFF